MTTKTLPIAAATSAGAEKRAAWKPPAMNNLTVSPDAGKAFQSGKPVQVRVAVHGVPTPLARNPMTMRAESVEEAWDKFCEANGISGTDHPKTIELVGPNG